MYLSSEKLEQALDALGKVLKFRHTEPYDIVVCGGSALLMTGAVTRATQDVDVLASRDFEGQISRLYPLPEALKKAAMDVAPELELSPNWLNSSASLHFPDFAVLPGHFWTDQTPREYGDYLTVRFVDRSGQIFLKLYAALNRAEMRDLEDLIALKPTEGEVTSALGPILKIEGLTNAASLPQILRALNHEGLIDRYTR